MNEVRLNIYEYLDYRAFLSKYYCARKASKVKFSYAIWAKEAGIKSRSYFSLVITGKRNLTSEYLELIIPTLNLKEKEEDYFRYLINFNQSQTVEERESYWRELIECMNVSKASTSIDTYKFLSTHWCPKLFSLTALDDIDKSTAALAETLEAPLREVQAALKTLKKLEMIREVDGQWCSTQKSIIVKSKFNNLALQSFHRRSLEDATKAIDLDSSERYLNSLLLLLNKDQYSGLQEDIDKFLQMVRVKYGTSSGSSKKLYQLNMNNIPISKTCLEIPNGDSNEV